MNSKKILFTAILVITGMVVVVLFMIINTAPSGQQGRRDAKPGSSISNFFGLTSVLKEDLDMNQVIADDPEMGNIIGIMKDRYGKKLNNKRIQIRMLGGLIRHLKKKNPYDWKERIKVILNAEFPEYAVEMAEKLDKLDEYKSYLKEHRNELQSLSLAEKKEKMLAKRREIFGAETDEIWEQEIAGEKVSEMLGKLDDRRDLTIYDKLNAYSTFTKSTYSDAADLSAGKNSDEIMVRNYDLTNSFLEMDSVQSDLRKMAPDERARFLKKLRESMGMKEDVVTKMAELDAMQDRMWENAPAYDSEKNKIMATYDGAEREQKLDEARKKYFGAGAAMIKFEEEQLKVSRFQFPRRWGRN